MQVKKLAVKVQKVKPEGLKNSDTSRVVLRSRIFSWDQSTANSARGAQKKKAVVRKESADTPEYDLYEQKATEMDVDDNEDGLSFVPSNNHKGSQGR